jgi:hypothetical protein
MKTIEMEITHEVKTKVSVKIPAELTPREEFEFINTTINEDPDKLIFDWKSQELFNNNSITEWEII